jgi:hypothetical protein
VSRSVLIVSFLLASVGGVLGFSAPVAACSCPVIGTPDIAAAPAAAEVGVLRNVDGVWVVEILHDAKQNLPRQVSVLAPIQKDGNCGVVWREGTVVSLVFGYDDTTQRLTADACSQIDEAALKAYTLPPGEPPEELILSEPPPIGGWSGWLLLMAAAAVGAVLLRNMSDPRWRSAWSKPNNARNSPVRRREDPTERGRFER